MRNPYDDHSDQEELVENIFSAADDDDDGDDDDEEDDDEGLSDLTERIHLNAETEELISISLVRSSNDCNTLIRKETKTNFELREQQYNQQKVNASRRARKLFCKLVAYGVGLMITSFSLLVTVPLYQSQFHVDSTKNNGHGMLLFIQPLATLFITLTTIICSAVFKWNIKLLKLPSIPGKKLILVSLCLGLASTLLLIGSYKRVACHLLDPLKGTALASSLLFYFFFCTRIMGLQKIFSATTSVVGLFISVDYGLCDEYHCHGNVISFKEKIPHTGWQGRAFWALVYTFGITLWSLHIALLEGCFGDLNDTSSKETTFLKTISKFVSTYDEQHFLNDAPHCDNKQDEVSRRNLHPMHVAMWIHIIATIFSILLGFVDMFPASDSNIKSFTQHWMETKHTFQCHLNISSHDTVDYTANISKTGTIMNSTPWSYQDNDIHVHDKRDIHTSENRHKGTHLNTFLKYKNWTSTHMPSKSSGNLKTVRQDNIKLDCSHNSGFYGLILICTYVGFVSCLLNFLSLSQSAVFTVAIATGTLPFIGLFWSFYKLDTQNGLSGTIIWSPSVSGELICSLLGTPIVFLGIVFLFKAHYNDMLKQSLRLSRQVMVT